MNKCLRLSNFQNICRTCLIQKDNLQKIFHLLDLLKECTSIRIDMDDDLPKLICNECITKLNNAYEFKKQCEVSEKTLLESKEIEGTTLTKLERSNLISQSHNNKNSETCEIDIKIENSHNVNEDVTNTCDKTLEFKINEEFHVVKIKPLNNDKFNKINTENREILDILKKQTVDLENLSTSLVKNNLTYNFDDQPLSHRLINEQSSMHKDNGCDNPYKNKFCNKISSRNKRKLKVKEKGEKINILPCPQCKRSFELEVDLEIHMFKHQKFDHISCPKCSKCFENERNLKRHFNTHMINKPYKCSFCNKSFAGSGDLNRHMRIHTGEKPYICASCGKRYPDSSGLSAHMKYHIGTKSFICTICSKSFIFPSELRSHMRVHTGERPYLCTECGQSFSQSYSLTKHKRKHTGERPYSCTECDKKFRLKEQLKYHIRTHTGYKPHICKICEIGFARPESLVIHYRSHTGERPYCCNICEKTFRSSKNLSQHKRTHNKGKKGKSCASLHNNLK